MKNEKNKFLLFCKYWVFLSVVLFSITGCRKEIELDDSDKNYPIELKLDESKGFPIFSWSSPQSVNINKFILVGSKVPFQSGVLPLESNANLVLFKEFYANDEFVYEDKSINIKGDLFYKLFVQLKDRRVESNEVIVEQEFISFNDFLIGSHINEEKTQATLIFSGRSIQVVDLINSEIVGTLINPSFDIDVNSTFMTRIANNYLYLQGSFSFQKIQINSGTLEGQGSSSFGGTTHLISDGKEFIYASKSSAFQGLTIYKHSQTNSSIISPFRSFDRNNSGVNKKLILLDNSTNNRKLVEISDTKAITFNFDGNTISNQVTFNLPNLGILVKNPAFDKDKTFAIFNTNGTVYNLNNFSERGKLGCINCSLFSVSKDSKYIYAAEPEFGNSFSIKKFDATSFELVDERKLLGLEVREILSTDKGLIVIGNDFISSFRGFMTVIKF